MATEYEEIKKATKNFQPHLLLGEVGFGPVYKGWLHEHYLTAVKPGSAGIAVAVKKMDKEGWQGHNQWVDEIHYLSQIHHPNMVKLIGYSFETDDRIVVYEFMPKGSLDNHLFTSNMTTRCDVYSFGVVLLELLSGLRVIDRMRPEGKHKLTVWAKPYLGSKRKLSRIMDSRLEGEYSPKEAYKVAQIALQCISPDPRLRPTMVEVVAALEKL